MTPVVIAAGVFLWVPHEVERAVKQSINAEPLHFYNLFWV